jgi:VanZ family protein
MGQLTTARSRLPRVLWALSAAFILYGTTIPFRFATDSQTVLAHLGRVTLNPFISPDTGGRLSMPDVVSNILLFVPFGVFGVWARPRARSVIWRIVFLTVLGAALSAGVETLQLFTLDRTSSVGDLCANTLGVFAGGLFGTLLRTSGGVALEKVNASGVATAAAFYPLLIATLLLCAGVLEPFDVTLDVGSVVSKIRALLHDPWQGGPVSDEGISLLQHLLFGSTLLLWLEQLRVRRAIVVAAAVGALAAIVLELSQLFIGDRMPGGSDALVGIVGSFCGLAVTRALSTTKRPFWCAGLFVLTAIGVALQQLTPFTVGPQTHPFQWVPFLNYYDFTASEKVSHSAELLLSYFPLGFAVAMTVRRPTARLATALAATLLIAAPVEYLQQFMGVLSPDITDIALSVAGAWLGLWAGTEGWRQFDAELAVISRR